MIYHLRAISNESDDFLLDIAIDSQATFLELHDFIQEKLDFDPSLMASFFTTDENWNKEKEITIVDMNEEGSDIFCMEQAMLYELFTNQKQRLLYAFDLFSERVLFMQLIQIGEGNLAAPVYVKLEGTPPVQLAEMDLSEDEVAEENLFSEEDDLFDDYNDLEGDSHEEYDDNNFY